MNVNVKVNVQVNHILLEKQKLHVQNKAQAAHFTANKINPKLMPDGVMHQIAQITLFCAIHPIESKSRTKIQNKPSRSLQKIKQSNFRIRTLHGHHQEPL